jgi:hypothetical protein
VRAVAHLINDFKKAGIISGREKSAMQRCAARSSLPYGFSRATTLSLRMAYPRHSRRELRGLPRIRRLPAHTQRLSRTQSGRALRGKGRQGQSFSQGD